LQPVTALHDPFAVLVDYAHTDDALSNVLSALRPVVGSGRIVLVFGCGGDRDRTKRPRMAATAVRGADIVFVTSDNPRTEDPIKIIDEILAGVPDDRLECVRVQPDRAAAIEAAVAAARAGDIVLIAGKGHEDYQIVGTEKRHFDDCEHARAALRRSASQVKDVSTTNSDRVREPQGAHA
jgi:UDP-N-acetylmuramoyl-L-alanyl-D-glutamate--2,6-diaminopimelate ligase